MKRYVAGAVALGLSVAAAAPSGAVDAGATGTVTVVHAVEGFVADAYLDGASEPALSGFEYRRVTDPLSLPAGSHRVDLRPAGAPATAPPALSGTFEVRAGTAASVVAQLDPAGQVALAVFPDEAATVAPGQSLLRLRHVAATGPVDVTVDGQPFLDDVPNVNVRGAVEGKALPAGPHELAVTTADGSRTLVAPQRLTLADGRPEAIYLLGREQNASLGLLAQGTGAGAASGTQVAGAVVTPDAAVPTAMAAGDSGLADPAGGRGPAVPAALALAAVALGLALARRRVRPVAAGRR